MGIATCSGAGSRATAPWSGSTTPSTGFPAAAASASSISFVAASTAFRRRPVGTEPPKPCVAASACASAASGRQGLLLVHHVGHHLLDELVGLGRHAAGDAAVHGGGARRLVLVLPRVGDRLVEVRGEALGDAWLGLGSGDGHVDGVGVLLAVEPPAAQLHEVVDVVDVEVVRREAEAEGRLAEDAQL